MVFAAIFSFSVFNLQAQTDTKTIKIYSPPSGSATDSILLWRSDSAVCKISSSLISVEPWEVATTTTKATGNTQNIYQNGKVGIGNFDTTAPAASLDIETGGTADTPNPTGFKLADGNQATGKILVSDATGIGTWQLPANVSYSVNYVQGGLGAGLSIPFGSTSSRYAGDSITLPPGTWQGNVQMLISQTNLPSGNGAWLRTTFCDSKTTYAASADIQGNTLISSPFFQSGFYFQLNGFIILKNSGTAPKTYYYWLWNPQFTNVVSGASLILGSSTGESRILAQPVTITVN